MLVRGDDNSADVREGIRWLTVAADRGHTGAQYDLGVALYSGVSDDPNYQEALRWFKAAAEAGHPEAAYNAGVFYEDGLAASADLSAAARWYHKAAEAGLVEAMHALGIMLVVGRGVPRDLRGGVELLAAARHQGDADVEPDIEELLRRLDPAERAEALQILGPHGAD
jgi:TPR repeat protein